MTAKLLELAIKAGLKKHLSEDSEYIGDFDWREFGKLVVDACVTQAYNVGTDSPLSDDAIYGADKAAARIQKYFEG